MLQVQSGGIPNANKLTSSNTFELTGDVSSTITLMDKLVEQQKYLILL